MAVNNPETKCQCTKLLQFVGKNRECTHVYDTPAKNRIMCKANISGTEVSSIRSAAWHTY